MAKQHKADGLYYLSGKMIETADACREKRRQFRKVGSKSKKAQVPVTLTIAKAMNVDGDASGWMMRKLLLAKKNNQCRVRILLVWRCSLSSPTGKTHQRG